MVCPAHIGLLLVGTGVAGFGFTVMARLLTALEHAETMAVTFKFPEVAVAEKFKLAEAPELAIVVPVPE